MNPKTILQKSRDLQKILFPLQQANPQQQLVVKTKEMLITFFKNFSYENKSYLMRVESINPESNEAFSAMCDILSSYIGDIENQISTLNNGKTQSNKKY